MKINEIFLSIQGEGLQMGLSTISVRSAGCNLSCSWCDFYDGTEMSVEDIKKEIERLGCKRICITGGEPLIQDFLPLG